MPLFIIIIIIIILVIITIIIIPFVSVLCQFAKFNFALNQKKNTIQVSNNNNNNNNKDNNNNNNNNNNYKLRRLTQDVFVSALYN